jgi:hypothetical protein
MTAQDLYSCDVAAAVPILHDTAVDLRIDKITMAASMMKESESYSSFMFGELDTSIAGDMIDSEVMYQMHGMVMNPLKLSVYRYQYELILDSVKSLTSGGEDNDGGTDSKATSRKSSVRQSSAESNASDVSQGRDSPIVLQFFYLFSIFFLNRF